MHRCHFQISAGQQHLPSVAARVEAFCTETHIPVATSNVMNLALDEVLSNIVKYAYDASEPGIVDVELTYSGNKFTATVQDVGRPFNPLRFLQQRAGGPLKDRRPGGLGILFVKNVMDSIAYDRTSDRNRLTLTIGVPMA